MDIGIVFGQMLVLLAMMLIGYFVYKKGWLKEESSANLSKLVVNIFNPVLVINGVLNRSTEDESSKILENLLMVIVYFVILLILSVFIPRLLRTGKRLKSIYQLMTIFSNIGFMGIPVINSIYGNDAVIYVAFYILVYNILLYTCGIFLSKRAAREQNGEIGDNDGISWLASLKKMINPGVVAAAIAVVLFVVNPAIPSPIATFCDYIGNATIPLSMILIGVSVAQVDLKEIFADWRIYVFILLRMILLPIVLIFALRGFVVGELQMDAVVFGVFIIEFGMPVGSIAALIVKEYGADSAYCTRGVVLSTLASIVTIPVICAFL